jgi:hypothetical protein
MGLADISALLVFRGPYLTPHRLLVWRSLRSSYLKSANAVAPIGAAHCDKSVVF